MIAEDPSLLWRQGYLDDYPANNLEFCEALIAGHVKSFDKMAALNEHLLRFFSDPTATTAHRISLRRVVAFGRLLRTQLAASHRLIPLPVALLSREAFQPRTARSWGSVGDGIHIKATIAAKARGIPPATSTRSLIPCTLCCG